MALRGEIALDVSAASSVEKNRLVTTFSGIPDAPVSRFDLTIGGAKHGILPATQSLCKSMQKAVRR